MSRIAHKLIRTDRRIIFALVGLAVLLPLLYGPFELAIKVTPEVQSVHDKVDSIPERGVLLISMDFDPASKPELYPMTEALISHAFSKNLRVVGVSLWVTGIGMAEELMSRLAEKYGKTDGTDYVFLGWAPGAFNVILGMGQDIYRTFPADYYGKETASMPVLMGVNTLRDVDYVVDIAAGDPGIETWIVYGSEKYKFDLGGGCTAVTAPGMYMYVNSGQINGLLGGMRGAAEYEALLGQSGKATGGMDAQSVTHFLIIFLVIASNVLYFMTKPSKGEKPR
ncbi:MAG: hypothetical protein V1800_09550 [Candidatus Latescibacterota bacterium]